MTDRKFIQFRSGKPRKPREYTSEEKLFHRCVEKVSLLEIVARHHNCIESELESLDSQYRKGEISLLEYDEEWRSLYSQKASLHEKYYQLIREFDPELTMEVLLTNAGGFMSKLDATA